MRNNGQKLALVLRSEDRGRTLADYLHRHADWFKHIELDQAFREGRFCLGELPVQADFPIGAESQLFYFRPPWDEPEVPDKIATIYESDELLVVEKPPCMPVTPNGDFLENSLLHRLRAASGLTHLSPLHRLDLETSGVCAFAKTVQARAHYQVQFERRRVEKTYHALVFGHLDSAIQLIDFPLQRHPLIFTRFMRAAAGPVTQTRVLWVEHLPQKLSRVALQPITGRTHQIRAHLAELGYPIVGDKKYASEPQLFLDWLSHRDPARLREQMLLDTQALHCARMTLRDGRGQLLMLTSAQDVFAEWTRVLGRGAN